MAFNQPNLCSSPAWRWNAITFSSNDAVVRNIGTIFVNDQNTLYALEQNIQQVRRWLEGSTIPATAISGNFSSSQGLAISTAGDIYIDNGQSNSRVEKWTVNASSGLTAMNVSGRCFSLFIDINETLYCSLDTLHQVMRAPLSSSTTLPTPIAGTGAAGSASNMLNSPRGIFVDIALSLYVADCGNNRVQLFLSGQSSGSTLAGSGAAGTTTLDCPIAVMLDKRGYLYILDHNNHRVVASGPDGFRCVAGCTGTNGSADNQLSSPWSFSFDRQGNIFVNDLGNRRIQKFLVATNLCSTYAIAHI